VEQVKSNGLKPKPVKKMQTTPYTIDQFASSSRLPSLPHVAAKLIELAQQEDPDFAEVSRAIQSDPVVSGKVLTTVNSALFGFRPKVETIRDAVNKLGVNMIRTLLLSFHLARHKPGQPNLEPAYQSHWRSSLTQAVIAELIAEKIKQDPASCFLAAMVQDIGSLAMLSEAPEFYLENILQRQAFPNVAAAERSVFGFSHVDVSIAIIRKWGLAGRFETAIRHHHDQVFTPRKRGSDSLAAVVHAANLGAAVVLSNGSSGMLNVSLDQWIQFLKLHFDISTEQAQEVFSAINARVNEYSILFKFNLNEDVRVDEVVFEAKNMLQEIALKYQLELASVSRATRKIRIENNELYRDALTGLYNRRFMDEHLRDLIAKSIHSKKPLGLLFLDLDEFKKINDSCGHLVGDKAIQHVAKWLGQSIREEDLAIRLGGDEFLVILKSTKENQFESVVARIAEQIPRLEIQNREIDVRFSVGAIYYQPARGDRPDPNWLIDQADQAMYIAKKQKAGRVAIQKLNGQTRGLDAGLLILPLQTGGSASNVAV
jgi:diguanylate cyclase (GGDEF)-like protein